MVGRCLAYIDCEKPPFYPTIPLCTGSMLTSISLPTWGFLNDTNIGHCPQSAINFSKFDEEQINPAIPRSIHLHIEDLPASESLPRNFNKKNQYGQERIVCYSTPSPPSWAASWKPFIKTGYQRAAEIDCPRNWQNKMRLEVWVEISIRNPVEPYCDNPA